MIDADADPVVATESRMAEREEGKALAVRRRNAGWERQRAGTLVALPASPPGMAAGRMAVGQSHSEALPQSGAAGQSGYGKGASVGLAAVAVLLMVLWWIKRRKSTVRP